MKNQNGLAKSLCNIRIEENSPTDAFDWDGFRLWRILEEMARYDCDVICLQEADFYEDIKPYFHNLGYNLIIFLFNAKFLLIRLKFTFFRYSSVFCPKYVPTLVTSNIDPEGCAIFYKSDIFQITQLRCQSINLNNEHNNQVV